MEIMPKGLRKLIPGSNVALSSCRTQLEQNKPPNLVLVDQFSNKLVASPLAYLSPELKTPYSLCNKSRTSPFSKDYYTY